METMPAVKQKRNGRRPEADRSEVSSRALAPDPKKMQALLAPSLAAAARNGDGNPEEKLFWFRKRRNSLV